jgi:DNA-binding beta-propeller fold protein YncE
MDVSGLVDDEYGDFLYDTVQGWLPSSRGVARDEGADTLTDVGPSALVPHPDGQRLFVANYNANSLTVYDLSLGVHGTLVREVDNLGEYPTAMVLSPDNNHLLVANYAGVVESSGATHSTIAVVDVDPESPTYLEVTTWITND